MDQHTTNLTDSNIRFLSLKPRLLKCIKPDRTVLKVPRKNDPQIFLDGGDNIASTATSGLGTRTSERILSLDLT